MTSIVLTGPESSALFAALGATTLREIEQEVARRVGPFQLRWVHNPSAGEPEGPASTTTTVAIPAVRSALDLGGLEDMYVLRRGRLRDGTRLPGVLHVVNPDPDIPPRDIVLNYDPGDRIRLVRQYRAQEGVLEVDRPYVYPPLDDEEIELHHLDPELELRPAVLAGLRRCFVVDRLVVDTTASVSGRIIDLTVQAPWLLTRDQVYDVAAPSGHPLVGWRVGAFAGGLFLTIGEWGMGRSVVVNRRPVPAATLAFGPDQTGELTVRAGTVNEPWDDDDAFPIPLDYAAAAGHIEGWRTARPRLSLVSQTGMWAEQKEAAAEFTRVATIFFDAPRHTSELAFSARRWLDNPLSNAP